MQERDLVISLRDRRKILKTLWATVDYIRQRFAVAWVLLPRSEIAVLERALIARFAAARDLYNLAGRSGEAAAARRGIAAWNKRDDAAALP